MRNKLFCSLFIAIFILTSCQPINTNEINTPTSEAATPTPSSSDTSPPVATEKNTDSSSSSPIDLPDLSRETFTIYQIADTTSPLAGLKTPAISGVSDSVSRINQQEGIFGAGLILKHFETNGQPDQAIDAYNTILRTDENPLMIFVYDAWVADLLSPLAAADGIILLTTAPSDTAIYGTENSTTFALSPTYSDQLIWLGDYMNTNWSVIQPDETGAIKLAIITWEAPYGLNALNEDVQTHLAANGVEVVFVGEMPYSYTADATNLILEARALGANVIYTDMSAFGTAQILNDLHWLALRENIFFIGSAEGLDISLYGFLLEQTYASEIYVPFPTVWWSKTDHPGIEQAILDFDNNNRSAGEKSIQRLIAQAGVDVIQHILENAIVETGLENLNSKSLYDQLIILENYPALNGVIMVTYSETQHSLTSLYLRKTGETFGEYTDTGYISEVPEWRMP